ncbi:MAG: fructosamine kinase family protein [Cyclobacteriaceae bacterium]|nr:fructosamine kinase family protein [Cyclobacteriaceae bacterium]
MFRSSDSSQFFESALFQTLGKSVEILSFQFVSGGCINNTLQLITSDGTFFLKWNQDYPEDMFVKEASGLSKLGESGNIFVPDVLGYGNVGEKNYLLLEYVESGRRVSDYWEDFGCSLALMHKNCSHSLYGLDHNNYIGRLPQSNEFQSDWIEFFIEKRLEVQIQLAIYNNLVEGNFVKKYRSLYTRLPELLLPEPPALLHGDLWSGNVMVSPEGKACIMDPAVYYGHREIELAFTQMFGGFDASFYRAYQNTYPLETGFGQRAEIYNIYPYMVHVNLFGQSYLPGVERVLRKYV